MKKNRCIKLTALLMAMMMFIAMMPVAASAGTTSTTIKITTGEDTKVLDERFVTYAKILEGDKETTLSGESDPNKAYTLKLEVAEPVYEDTETGNPDTSLPEDTEKVRLSYDLPENVAAVNGSNGVVSWTYDAEKGDVVFRWVGEKQNSFSADITVVPNFPDRFGISGTYMLGTTGTGAALVANHWMDGTRDKLTSVGYSTAGGYATPSTVEDPMWTLKHVTGDYYTIQASDGRYLKIIKSNKGLDLESVDESQAQKLLVKQGNGGYGFVYEGLAVNNSGNNPEKGFASYEYANGKNDTFKLFAASEIQHAASTDVSGTWAIVNADKNTILTARSSSSGKLSAIAADNIGNGLLPRNDINLWTFTRVNRDWYTVSTDSGYLNIKSNGASISGSAQNLLVRFNGENLILASGENTSSDYSLANANNGNDFGSAKYNKTATTRIVLKNTSDVIIQSVNISGNYAITTSVSGAALVAEANGTKLVSVAYDEYDDGEVGSLAKPITLWTFTKVSGNWYTVKSSAGYLKIQNNIVSVTPDESLVYIQENNGKYRLTAGNQWALNNQHANPKDGYQGYDKGYATDAAEWHTLRHVKTDLDNQLLFDLNGGTGEKPTVILAKTDVEVTLPGTSATNSNGKAFIGWAETTSFYTVNQGEKSTYHRLYKAGETFKMRNGITTLYAVYDTTSYDVRFGVRLDGQIMDEPNVYDTSAYGGHFWMKGNIRKANSWVIDIDGQKNVNGYYLDNNVMAALNQVPSAEQIATALKNEGNIIFDPETQYIHWYVLKYTGKEWHIDGVVRNKAKVGITYDANVENTKEKTTVLATMPVGYEMAVGTRILIGTNKGETTVKKPSRDGYIFTGWNTKKDGTGTAYSGGGYLRMTENVYLYAQWEEENLLVMIESDWAEGKPAYAGTEITLTAKLIGFENKDYRLQWEYSLDHEQTWTAIDASNNPEIITATDGDKMKFVVNETTAECIWRVVAVDIKNK